MHARARDLVMACGGGRIYEIKTLRSNLAPEEGGGVYSRGAYNRASTVYIYIIYIYMYTYSLYIFTSASLVSV